MRILVLALVALAGACTTTHPAPQPPTEPPVIEDREPDCGEVRC